MMRFIVQRCPACLSQRTIDKLDNPDLPTLQPWRPMVEPPAEVLVAERNPYFHRVDQRGRQLGAQRHPARTGGGIAFVADHLFGGLHDPGAGFGAFGADATLAKSVLARLA